MLLGSDIVGGIPPVFSSVLSDNDHTTRHAKDLLECPWDELDCPFFCKVAEVLEEIVINRARVRELR